MVVGLVLLTLPQIGCVGLTSQLLYWFNGGDKIDAEFDGLQGQQVAIVCVSNASATGPASIASMVERSVGMLLKQKGRDIRVIHQEDVAKWIDTNDWDQMDYREIGRGVGADMVLAIDLDNITLHEGRTLYKGRADVTVTVYDMKAEGQVAFRRSLPEFSFPQNAARPVTEMSEGRFRALFVEVLAQQVARYFCAYQIQDDFARDALLLGG